jgi:hypothetical protein
LRFSFFYATIGHAEAQAGRERIRFCIVNSGPVSGIIFYNKQTGYLKNLLNAFLIHSARAARSTARQWPESHFLSLLGHLRTRLVILQHLLISFLAFAL